MVARDPLGSIQKMVSGLADIEKIRKVVARALQSGIGPTEIMFAMNKGLEDVGRKYEEGVAFLSDLMMAGIIANEIYSSIEPYLDKSAKKTRGKVVIGTVKGDLHDIGKNIVISMLSSSGFSIIDLGVDVPCEKFIDAVKKEKPDIVAMSCLLTISMDEMGRIINVLKANSLRDKVRIMVGGRPITQDFADAIGADAYGSTAVDAVRVAENLVPEGSA